MKVYLSGPISDSPKATEHFKKAEEYVSDWAEEVINPISLGTGRDWVMVMREAIILLMGADAVYMLRGWRSSKGASLERLLAQKLEMHVFYEACMT